MDRRKLRGESFLAVGDMPAGRGFASAFLVQFRAPACDQANLTAAANPACAETVDLPPGSIKDRDVD
jgi:hypothetical protein